MGKQPKKKLRTKAEIARDRVIRAKYQSRPTLAEVVGQGEHELPIRQGEYLSLMEFAAHIRTRRKQLNLSLTDLSTLTGIDKAALSRLENGLVDNPTVGTLIRIAGSLNSRVKFALEDDSPAKTR